MSSQSSLPQVPQTPVELPSHSSTEVYTLTVFIRRTSGEVVARAANLELPEQTASTVREALRSIVQAAKDKLTAHPDNPGWLEEPVAPSDNESQFRVPLHL